MAYKRKSFKKKRFGGRKHKQVGKKIPFYKAKRGGERM